MEFHHAVGRCQQSQGFDHAGEFQRWRQRVRLETPTSQRRGTDSQRTAR